MPVEVKQFEFHSADGTWQVPIELRLCPQAHRIKLSVRRGGKALLSFPKGVRQNEILHFLREQTDWLRRALQQSKNQPAAIDLSSHLEKFPWVSVAGKLCTLECAETTARPFLVFREGEELVIFRHREGNFREADLKNLLRELATQTLLSRTQLLAKEIGATFQRVSVRNQQGRWGSCSSRGTISLNWRLVLLPPALQDYVILHELAHTREMNHSDRFWSLLAQWDSAWKENDRALTRQWGHLMDLGREAD